MKTPTEFERWNAKDGTFAIDYPAGWMADGGGKQGLQWAEFSSGSAKITVETSMVASLIGDIASAGQGATMVGGEQMDPELAPIHKAHRVIMESKTQEYMNYKEGSPGVYRAKLGDSRKSKFRASTLFGGSIRGYRATSLSIDKGIIVFCFCNEGDWPKLKPAFDKILSSVGMGE